MDLQIQTLVLPIIGMWLKAVRIRKKKKKSKFVQGQKGISLTKIVSWVI